jgi:nitroimidazol reductase NimA-like FMN-containing flavoprotein (pyridoxamine 5'-phosphate oxidase superfamily)
MEQEAQEKQQERILRVREMECRFDAVQTAMAQGNDAALLDPDVIGMLQTLTQYYESGQWLEDYERDEQGEFPAELKRGVLSQDALYDLLCKIGEMQKTHGEESVMFRDMLRIKQQLTEEECIEILKAEPRGVLSVLGDDGYPYGMPMNHWYCEENGHLYFHSGMKGHKVDAVRNHEKVSFCVYDQGFRKDGEWALNIKSVIVFGRIRFLENQQEAVEIIRKLSYKYTSDAEYIEREIRAAGARTLCLELIPEHMTGKLVNES